MPLDISAQRFDPRAASLADEVYGVLSRAIVDGALHPGEKLRDTAIAEHLGISRTPVREAVQRLARQGLVEVVPHRYTRVALQDESLADEAAELLVLMSGLSLRVALERMTPEEHAHALDLFDDVVALLPHNDVRAVTEASTAFYRHVTIATRNRLLVSVLREAHVPAQRFAHSWRKSTLDSTTRASGFDELRRAIEERDGAAAEAAVRARLGLN